MQTRRELAARGAALLASLVIADFATGSGDVQTPGLRILALGDSYTIGEGVATEQRWPEQLAAALREAGLAIAPPRIIATTGWRTDDLTKAVARTELTPPYDLVTLLIGVNDQYQDYREGSYPQRFAALLRRAVQLAGNRLERVIVVSIPDYSVTPFVDASDRRRVAAALERYNRTNREAATAAQVGYVDITEISRKAAEDRSLLADDRLHPSGRMYAQWVERILPLAEGALRGHTR